MSNIKQNEYLIDLSMVKESKAEAWHLAFVRGHSENSSTHLMSTQISGQRYDLYLSGAFETADYSFSVLSSDGAEKNADFINSLLMMDEEDRHNQFIIMDCPHNPWFEWVDHYGVAISAFEAIYTNPSLELERLVKSLAPTQKMAV